MSKPAGRKAAAAAKSRAKAKSPPARRPAAAKPRRPEPKTPSSPRRKSSRPRSERGNAAAADKLLARDFSFIDAAGQVHSRRSVLKALRASPRGAGTRVKVRDYGRVALVTGSYKSAQAGERSDLYALDVWIKGDDGWQALIHHNNVLARPDAPTAHVSGAPRPPDAPPPRCENPLEVVPYKPKSQAERDIIAAFQALETAVTRNDPGRMDEPRRRRVRGHPHRASTRPTRPPASPSWRRSRRSMPRPSSPR